MRTCAGFLAVLVSMGAAGRGQAAAVRQQVGPGQALFQQKCVACHTIGQGDRVGPDLAGVSLRRNRSWLTRWISAPDQVLAQGDSVARALLRKYRNVPMPNQHLTADQVAAVIAYVTAQGTGGAAASQLGAAAVAGLPPGDAAIGKALFTGTRRFQNGGPPCMGCHSIAGIGALGGGALGPDLTAAQTKYGGGLAFVLASIPFPTMQPIFAGRSLTSEEQADVAAFLQQAVAVRPSRAIAQLMLLGAIGTMLLFGLAHLTWRGRLTTIRRHMVESERSGPHPKRVRNR